LRQVLGSKRGREFLTTFHAVPERLEETGFEPPDRMAGRQQVSVKLLGIDLRASGVWKEHDGILSGSISRKSFANA